MNAVEKSTATTTQPATGFSNCHNGNSRVANNSLIADNPAISKGLEEAISLKLCMYRRLNGAYTAWSKWIKM